MTNIPVDWKVFESKFSQNPRAAFEGLVTTLFCHEMGLSHGIFRYFNQPYIETQPVMAPDGLLTGFQAKYYDASTRISSKEVDFKNAIADAKQKYAGISRIIFYINKEMSVSKRPHTQKPIYQENIETHGESLGITVEWRGPSHIEQILLALPTVRDLYFNPMPGLSQWVEQIQNRSDSIRSNIQSEIPCQGERIKIYYDMQKLDVLWESEKAVCIIYGDAGTGKSGVVKDLISRRQEQGDEFACFLFSSTDLDVEEESLFLRKYGHYQLEDLFTLYSQEKRKVCVIESAEKFSALNSPQVFAALVHKFIDHGWKMIFTIRTVYKDSFCNILLKDIAYDEFRVESIADEVLEAISEQYHFPLPQNQNLRSLLKDFFYLKLYLKLDPAGLDLVSSEELFLQQVWKEVICDSHRRAENLPVRREEMVTHIVFSMLQRGSTIYISSANDDYMALTALEDSGIIAVYDNSPRRWMMSHDVYEELIIKHILTQRYQEGIEAEKVLEGFGLSLRARKLYRIWLESVFASGGGRYADFLISMLQSGLDQAWKDETLIALMQSDQVDCFRAIDPILSQERYSLFTRMVFLLNTACRDIDRELLKKLSTPTGNKYRFTCPVGRAWFTVFQYIYNNRGLIPWTAQNLDIVTNTLKTWTAKYETGETTGLAGRIALYLKSEIWKRERYPYTLRRDSRFITLTDVILAAAMELKQELTDIFQSFTDTQTDDSYKENYLLLQKSLSNVYECGRVCQAIPEQVLSLAERYWCDSSQREHNDYSHDSMEYYFGLSHSLDMKYKAESALQTPLFFLLQEAPIRALNTILRIMNYATNCYSSSKLATEYSECSQIEIHFTDGTVQRQVCSDRLWKMYRGTHVAPKLLESVLMALEKWLLDLAEFTEEKTICQFCEYLLRKSASAAITAVVLSVVIAYPDKLFPISCILLKTKEVFVFDIARLQAEHSADFLKGTLASHRWFDHERMETNALPFRKKQFEQVLVDYQIEKGILSENELEERKTQLYAAFDEATQSIDSWEEVYQFAYYRSDLRRRQISSQKVSQDRVMISVVPDMPENLTALSEQAQRNYEDFMRHVPLMLWADAKLRGNQEAAQQYPQFEGGIEPVVNEIYQILEEGEADSHDISSAVNACAVLLRERRTAINETTLAFCTEVLLATCLNFLNRDCHLGPYELNGVISAVASLVSSDDFIADWSSPLFMLLALVMYNGKQNEALNSVASILWPSAPNVARKLMHTYAVLAPRYFSQVLCYNGISTRTFFEQHSQEIQALFQEEVSDLEDIPLSGLEVHQLIALQRMIPSGNVEGSFVFVLKIGDRVWGTLLGPEDTDRDGYQDYEGEYAYTQWLGDYVLGLSAEQQSIFLDHLVKHVKYGKEFTRFLRDVIQAEDIKPRYSAFWGFWDLLKNYIFSAFERAPEFEQQMDEDRAISFGIGNVLTEYLLAGPEWREGITTWHSLREDCAVFYKTAVNRTGAHPAILYSVGRVLNSIGSQVFFEDGVEWLSDIISNNPQLRQTALPTNTIYYMEEYMYRYVQKRLYLFKSDALRKHKVLNVLDFLVNRGSPLGFLLREDII